MTRNIEKTIRARRLEDRVWLLGQVSEDLLHGLYRGADLFVMPNIPVPGDIEGFGVVMIEAGAAGLPVVAADLEGIRDVVTPGRNGALVEPGDSRGFLREIERYGDPVLRREESARAASYVRATFGWAGIADQHLAHIRACVRSARDEAPDAPEDRQEPSEYLRDEPEKDGAEDVSEDHARTPDVG